MPPKSIRNGIFISYSHADKKWLDRVKIHLKPLERDHNVIVWSDTKLRSGDKWLTEINRALASAKVAIMLISADFLASDFIHNDELPPLLKAANKEGLIILPIIVSRCSFSFSPLNVYQTVNDPGRPLNSLTDGQVEEVFFRLFERVREIFVTPTLSRTLNKAAAHKIRKIANPASEAAPEEPVLKTGGVPEPNATKSIKTARIPATQTAEAISPVGHSALLVKSNGEWDILPVSRQSETGRVLSLTFQSPTPAQRSFLLSLRQYDNLASIAYSKQTYPCKLELLRLETEGTRETWYLDAIVGEINLRPEVTFNRITPNMQAQIRARVLLLDEASPGNGPIFMGMGSYLEIRESPFPALYQLLSKQPDVFNEAAKLIATWYLQIGCIVEYILELELSLKGQVMTVKFEGKRRARHDEPPAVIRVEGTCDLSRPVATRTLRLGPLNRY